MQKDLRKWRLLQSRPSWTAQKAEEVLDHPKVTVSQSAQQLLQAPRSRVSPAGSVPSLVENQSLDSLRMVQNIESSATYYFRSLCTACNAITNQINTSGECSYCHAIGRCLRITVDDSGLANLQQWATSQDIAIIEQEQLSHMIPVPPSSDEVIRTVGYDICRCNYCRSTNIEVTAWVDPNTNEFIPEQPSYDNVWCHHCEGETHLEIATFVSNSFTNAIDAAITDHTIYITSPEYLGEQETTI